MPDPIRIDATADTVGFHFGGQAPIASIEPHQLVRLTTLDCFGGLLQSPDDLPSVLENHPFLNPVTGPLAVNGARPGDTLAVHIAQLTPASEVGWSVTLPHFGALTGQSVLDTPLAPAVWRYPIDHARKTVQFTARSAPYATDLPWAPMLGTVGVAPAHGEVALSITNGPHGGNLDCPQLGAGTTVYLPVGQDGALLAVGDGHARQGPGELCGAGVEVPMTVALVVEVLSGVTVAGPWLETDTTLRRVGVARPLEDAYRIAHHDLVDLLSRTNGVDRLDAYQLVSQAGVADIGNVVNNQFTIAAGIPKGLLDRQAFTGAHDRLRTIVGAR